MLTGDAGLAIYHAGTPGWTVHEGQLLGALLRNAPKHQRAAHGTDAGTHTQRYWLGAASAPATPGRPLRSALAATTPMVPALVAGDATPSTAMPTQAGLAQVSAGATAILRAARTQPSTSGSISFIVRVYAPDATGSGDPGERA